jgi:hypothetical protein
VVCIGPDARKRQRPSSSLLHEFSERQGRRRPSAVCVGDTPRSTCLAMAKTYRRSVGTRLINALFPAMTRLGLGASYRYVLTVPGRRTGLLSSTPVDVITVLRTYISEIRVTRRYFDATQDSPDENMAAELPRHAVFRLTLR